MMNADKQVLYSGVAQEEWESKSKHPKILSNGPKTLKPKVKASRNTGFISFLILTLVAILLSLGIVIGLHYLKFSEENGLEFVNYGDQNETEVKKPVDDGKSSVMLQSSDGKGVDKDQKEVKEKDKPTPKDPNKEGQKKPDDTNKKDQKKEEGTNKEDQKKENDAMKEDIKKEDEVKKEDQKKDNSKDDQKKDMNSASPDDKKDILTSKENLKGDKETPKVTTKRPSKPKTTTEEDDWLDIIKTDDRLYNYNDIFNKMASSSKEESDKDKLNQSKEDIYHLNDKDKLKQDSHEVMDFKNSSRNGTNTVKDKDHESLKEIISSFASKYFNSSSVNKEEILTWIEKLTARPSLEVIVIASGIIFVGLALLIIAITCLLTRTRRIRIRREKLSRAVKDLEGGEKVILLTDEPSEDEYVKT